MIGFCAKNELSSAIVTCEMIINYIAPHHLLSTLVEAILIPAICRFNFGQRSFIQRFWQYELLFVVDLVPG